MKAKFLLIISVLSVALKINAQSITQLPGEGALNYTKVFQGSGRDGGTDCSCFFVRGKGMLSIGFEVTKTIQLLGIEIHCGLSTEEIG